ISWYAASRRAAAIEQQALEMESTEQEANAGTPAEPDDGAPAPNDEAESTAPVVVPPAEAAAEADPAPATDPVGPPAEEQQEDGS
ncbi:MAG: hypothetical protein PVI67_07245, partial [Anaerolineae bacterium]